MTLVWQYKICANIRGDSPGMGRQTTVGLSTAAIFSVFDGYFFGYCRHEASVYGDVQSVVGFSVIPKGMTGYFALNSVFAPVWLAETVRLRKIIA